MTGQSTSWSQACVTLVAVGVVSLFAAPARAQFDSAQVSGVVQDATGAVLPGVDVTLVSVGTRNRAAGGHQ